MAFIATGTRQSKTQVITVTNDCTTTTTGSLKAGASKTITFAYVVPADISDTSHTYANPKAIIEITGAEETNIAFSNFLFMVRTGGGVDLRCSIRNTGTLAIPLGVIVFHVDVTYTYNETVWYTDVYPVASMAKYFFIPGDESLVLTPNQRAIAAVDAISSVTVSKSGNNLVVTFTPITDSGLLNLIDQGKTMIRVQLLGHQASGGKKCRLPDPPRMSTTNTLTTEDLGYTIPVWSTTGIRAFTRLRAWQPDYYGHTWLNLTSAQLRAGTATLTDIYSSNWSRNYPSQIYDDHAGMTTYEETWKDKEYGAYGVRRFAVEIYVPALGPGTTDTFQYERQGHRKFSSNYVGFY